MEHLIVPEGKKILKDRKKHVKRTQDPAQRGLPLYKFSLNYKKNNDEGL